MIFISYPFVIGLISLLWILNRILVWKKTGAFSIKRELELILVYICLIVVARFTLFPFRIIAYIEHTRALCVRHRDTFVNQGDFYTAVQECELAKTFFYRF